ncbi:MAG: hypothetical protein ACK56I_05880, partial [bacterium]
LERAVARVEHDPEHDEQQHQDAHDDPRPAPPAKGQRDELGASDHGWSALPAGRAVDEDGARALLRRKLVLGHGLQAEAQSFRLAFGGARFARPARPLHQHEVLEG